MDEQQQYEFDSRQKATMLIMALEVRLRELSDQIAALQASPERIVLSLDLAAQSWHLAMVKQDCKRKGWL